MWKATLSGLRAHKLRLVLTALSVVLGVAFVTGTLILGDTLTNTFDQLFSGVYGKISVQVRQPSAVKDQQGNKTFTPMPESILGQVQNLPGVAAAEGSVSGFAQIVDKHGKAIAPQAPTLGTSYGTVPEISGFTLSEGKAPIGSDQVVIDKGTADQNDFHIGDKVRILFQGPPQEFTISGIIKFGKANGLAGATVASFDLPTAQALLNRPGQFDTVNLLAKSGTSASSLKSEVSKQLPNGFEAITGSELAKESAEQVNKALGFFTTFLLIFALISLFVGSFIILNTFSILVAQRTRELALLRALGASRRQVLLSTLGEAGRGRPDRRGGRGLRRGRGGGRSAGRLQGDGDRPALVRDGLQGPHRDRGRHRRRRREPHRLPQPGPAGVEDPAGGRARRPHSGVGRIARPAGHHRVHRLGHRRHGDDARPVRLAFQPGPAGRHRDRGDVPGRGHPGADHRPAGRQCPRPAARPDRDGQASWPGRTPCATLAGRRPPHRP